MKHANQGIPPIAYNAATSAADCPLGEHPDEALLVNAAIAFQASSEYFEHGTFHELETRASANLGNLPKGSELEATDKRAEYQKPATKAPAMRPSARKGSTIACAGDFIIAEQPHIDLNVHDGDQNKASSCTCGQNCGSKLALSRHPNVAAKVSDGGR